MAAIAEPLKLPIPSPHLERMPMNRAQDRDLVDEEPSRWFTRGASQRPNHRIVCRCRENRRVYECIAHALGLGTAAADLVRENPSRSTSRAREFHEIHTLTVGYSWDYNWECIALKIPIKSTNLCVGADFNPSIIIKNNLCYIITA